MKVNYFIVELLRSQNLVSKLLKLFESEKLSFIRQLLLTKIFGGLVISNIYLEFVCTLVSLSIILREGSSIQIIGFKLLKVNCVESFLKLFMFY